LSNNSG